MSSPNRPPTDAAREGLHRIGKYEITRTLGQGGMGTVYLATDGDLKRTVALKVLPKDRANNPILVRRFKSEGQAAALLQHKNIVSVFEAGQADGYLFLALEYVEGIDLLEWVNRHGPIPAARSVEIIRQAAAALQHAFERHIVHRDIKPSNLMISREGNVKLTDMGLARSIDDTLDTTITRDGTTVGTVDYMAPEQAGNSKAADIRSDIYSLGCTWYHLLTGSPPYPMGSVTNKITAHISAPLPDPRALNPKVPEALIAVIHRMMAKRKEQRYQSPQEIIDDLDSSGMKHNQGTPDLLAMFGDEPDFNDSNDEVKAVRSGGSSTDFTVGKQKKTGPSVSASGAKSLVRQSRDQSTRAEIKTVSPPSDPRALLVRMAVDSNGKTVYRRPKPWGLIVFGVILISAVLGAVYALNQYSGAQVEQNSFSPYEKGPAESPAPTEMPKSATDMP